MNDNYNKTKRGIINRVYNHQKSSSKIRGHNPPDYTFDELYEWVIFQSNFKELYNNWVKNGYQKDFTPSIDRLDESKGYSFNNIQLVTWKENYMKEAEKNKRKVNQYTINGKYVRTWGSIKEASENLSINHASISCVCYFKNKTAGGFVWRFANEYDNKNIEKVKIMYSGKAKKVAQYTLEGNLVQIYNSITEVYKQINISAGLISEACKGNRKSAGGYQWRYLEGNIVLNIGKIKRLHSGKPKKVAQYTKDNKLVNVFNSIKEAADALKIQSSSIVSVCKKKRKSTYGYVWKYIEGDNDE